MKHTMPAHTAQQRLAKDQRLIAEQKKLAQRRRAYRLAHLPDPVLEHKPQLPVGSLLLIVVLVGMSIAFVLSQVHP